jgi:hypothetical protein
VLNDIRCNFTDEEINNLTHMRFAAEESVLRDDNFMCPICHRTIKDDNHDMNCVYMFAFQTIRHNILVKELIRCIPNKFNPRPLISTPFSRNGTLIPDIEVRKDGKRICLDVSFASGGE